MKTVKNNVIMWIESKIASSIPDIVKEFPCYIYGGFIRDLVLSGRAMDIDVFIPMNLEPVILSRFGDDCYTVYDGIYKCTFDEMDIPIEFHVIPENPVEHIIHSVNYTLNGLVFDTRTSSIPEKLYSWAEDLYNHIVRLNPNRDITARHYARLCYLLAIYPSLRVEEQTRERLEEYIKQNGVKPHFIDGLISQTYILYQRCFDRPGCKLRRYYECIVNYSEYLPEKYRKIFLDLLDNWESTLD